MRKSLIDVWPSNFLSSALGTFMSSCCISHCVVYIIFFLIWQFELLRKIFLEVKIKSGGYYRALAVASYREMSRVGHSIIIRLKIEITRIEQTRIERYNQVQISTVWARKGINCVILNEHSRSCAGQEFRCQISQNSNSEISLFIWNH